MPPPTFEQWIEREPRLSMLISTMLNVGCTDQQIATTVPVLAFILDDGIPLAVPPAMLAPAPTVAPAPAPAATAKPAAATPAPTPIATPELLFPTRAEPPKRKPFEKALATACGPTNGGLWSLPDQNTPAPAADSRTRKWDKALRTVCGTMPTMAKPYSMPDDAA